MITVSGNATLRVWYSVDLDMTVEEFDAMSEREQNELLDSTIDWMEECKSGELDDLDVDDVEEVKEGECKTCFGEGGITVENFNDPESFECPDCHGTGESKEGESA